MHLVPAPALGLSLWILGSHVLMSKGIHCWFLTFTHSLFNLIRRVEVEEINPKIQPFMIIKSGDELLMRESKNGETQDNNL